MSNLPGRAFSARGGHSTFNVHAGLNANTAGGNTKFGSLANSVGRSSWSTIAIKSTGFKN